MPIDSDIHNLAQRVVVTLKKVNAKLSVAESCTGGLLAGALTDVPGASDVFEYGFVTYANRAKVDLVGVPADLIAEHGAVSRSVAIAMARGARKAAQADYALAITGIAGPGGGSVEKPVGLVFIACAGPDEGTVTVERHCFDDTGRAAIRAQSVKTALKLVLDALTTN